MLNITCKSDPIDLRIYINDILHLYLRKDRIISFQSWYSNATSYSIEFVLDNGIETLEYDDKDKWTKVLELLDKNI